MNILDSLMNILGLDYNALSLSDTALLSVLVLVFVFVLDWTFRLLSMVVGTLTKRR